jgi:hypothetical protein
MVDNTKKKSKFSFFRIIYESFGILFDNFKFAIIIGGTFSVIFTLVKILFGNSFFCYNPNFEKTFICSSNTIVFVLSGLIFWFITCEYIRNWYQVVILKDRKFSIKNILPQMLDVKIYGVLALFFVSVLIAMLSGFILFVKEPNPNWVIELSFFSLMFLGLFVPLIALPVLSYIPFVLENTKLPKIKDLWRSAKGNYLVIMVSFGFILTGNFLIMLSVTNYFIQVSADGNVFVIVMAEFLYNMILMFIMSVYTNYCYMQKKFLFERS